MTAHGFTLFCDDVRQEVGNKKSFMGCYEGDIVVSPRLPATLQKLVLYVRLMTPISKPLTRVTFNVYLPGDPEDAPTVVGELPDIPEPKRDPETESGLQLIGTTIQITPVNLKQEGRIYVRALADGEIVKLGSIRVKSAVPTSEGK